MSPSFEQRAQNILRAATGSVAATPDDTVWGPYRCFDGLFLAQLALDQREEGNRLLSETLDLIDRNVADEASGARNKWHLAEFALHPVWLAYSQFNDRINRENTARIERSSHFSGLRVKVPSLAKRRVARAGFFAFALFSWRASWRCPFRKSRPPSSCRRSRLLNNPGKISLHYH